MELENNDITVSKYRVYRTLNRHRFVSREY